MHEIFARYKNQLPQLSIIIALGLVLLIENIGLMLFSTRQIQLSSSSRYVFGLSISILLTLWVHYDSRQSGFTLGLDQTMFIFWGWPLMFPLYVFSSRGFRRGSLLLLTFLGIAVFTLIAAIVITVAINTGTMIISLPYLP